MTKLLVILCAALGTCTHALSFDLLLGNRRNGSRVDSRENIYNIGRTLQQVAGPPPKTPPPPPPTSFPRDGNSSCSVVPSTPTMCYFNGVYVGSSACGLTTDGKKLNLLQSITRQSPGLPTPPPPPPSARLCKTSNECGGQVCGTLAPGTPNMCYPVARCDPAGGGPTQPPTPPAPIGLIPGTGQGSVYSAPGSTSSSSPGGGSSSPGGGSSSPGGGSSSPGGGSSSPGGGSSSPGASGGYCPAGSMVPDTPRNCYRNGQFLGGVACGLTTGNQQIYLDINPAALGSSPVLCPEKACSGGQVCATLAPGTPTLCYSPAPACDGLPSYGAPVPSPPPSQGSPGTTPMPSTPGTGGGPALPPGSNPGTNPTPSSPGTGGGSGSSGGSGPGTSRATGSFGFDGEVPANSPQILAGTIQQIIGEGSVSVESSSSPSNGRRLQEAVFVLTVTFIISGVKDCTSATSKLNVALADGSYVALARQSGLPTLLTASITFSCTDSGNGGSDGGNQGGGFVPTLDTGSYAVCSLLGADKNGAISSTSGGFGSLNRSPIGTGAGITLTCTGSGIRNDSNKDQTYSGFQCKVIDGNGKSTTTTNSQAFLSATGSETLSCTA